MRRSQRFLAATLVAGLLASCAPSPQERMARAEKALEAHRYSHARADYQAILRTFDSTVALLIKRPRMDMVGGKPAPSVCRDAQ